jgi:uncharacterized DUF497 family protein
VPTKPLVMTAHARLRMRGRRVMMEWIELTARTPEWTEPDPRDLTIERRFRVIGEFGGRILRVACVETTTAIRVISVMFDRSARRKS